MDEETGQDTDSGVTVEDVFNLESGWSVEALGEDDAMMEIGDEVDSAPSRAANC